VIVADQFADVGDHQAQQIDQVVAQFGTVFGQQFEAESQTFETALQPVDRGA
jgi:hypothetical protein